MFKIKTVVKIGIIGIIIVLGIVSLFYFATKSKEIVTKSKEIVEVRTYKNENGWGYDIYMNGKMLIHQPHIPALPGIRGFSKESSAFKLANLAAEKIKNNINPPSLTQEEVEKVLINDK